MLKHSVRNRESRAHIYLSLLLVAVIATPIAGWSVSLTLPADLALRVRLDDTLTSTDSQVGDPFSATVVDQGKYHNARVYGHISSIETSGRVKGNTTMMLRFDRLVMPDGRRALIHAELVELYDAPSGEKVDVEGAIQSGGRGEPALFTPRLERGPERSSAASSEGARGPASAPSLVALVDSELRRFTGAKKSP